MKKLKCMVYNLPGNQMKKFFVLIIYFFLSMNLFSQTTVGFFAPGEKQILKYQSLEQNIFTDKTKLQLSETKLERKSVAKAFFYSLLIPGLGEAYVGRTGYTKIFLSIELVGWGVLLGNYQYVSWLKEDYKNFGRQHAAISDGSKNDEYWINIGKYDNIYEYNEQRRRDRNVSAIYNESAINYWRWDSHKNRLDYDARRINARELEQNDVYYIGAIVLNHLVSAINALRVARAYNKNLEQNNWQMGMKFDQYQNGLSLSFSKQF